MASFIPPAFKRLDALPDFLDWVAALPIDPIDKKSLILDWSSITGVAVPPEQIRAAIPELERDEHPPPPAA